jgi:Ni,Fe-hydrogenase I cytochrome b subunit
MFETINNWIVTYMETPYYQRTIECDCLFYLAIIIYLALAAAAIFIVWLIVTRFKKFVDKVAEKEAKYKEEEK